MKTLNCKLQPLNIWRLFAFLFVFIILNFKVLSFNFPSVSAQTRLQYPIPNLGYCRDAKECYLYCEIPQNKAACWSYGKYKLGSQVLGVATMSEEEKNAMQQKAKEYAITFPIADLGNCAGPQECRDFCEQPANRQTCMEFAKKKGFHREMERPDGIDAQKRDELLQKAINELGCTSMESCSNVCESDHSRCEAFARRHGVYQEPPQSSGRYSAQEKRDLVEKAKSELGCTSMESCKSACEKDPQRCMEFAKKHGLAGDRGEPTHDASPDYGTQRFRKGICDSEESCKKYCQDHPNECPGFQGYTRATQGGSATEADSNNYVGPSGCRNEEECKKFCEQNPTQCPGYMQSDDYKTHILEKYQSTKSSDAKYQSAPYPSPQYRPFGPTPYKPQPSDTSISTQQYNTSPSHPNPLDASPYAQPSTDQYQTTNTYNPSGDTGQPANETPATPAP